jgi:hypothetical protein
MKKSTLNAPPVRSRLGKAFLIAFGAAAVEILPPLTLHAAGRSLVLIGQGVQTLGVALEQLGGETLKYAERQRRRNAVTLGMGYPKDTATTRAEVPA